MPEQPGGPPSFEKDLDDLEAVVKQLEAGDLPLEQSLALFEKGVALSDSCRTQLDAAETRVEVLLKRGGQIRAEPFRPENG